MQRLENKYSFNREINDMRINKEKIVLPVDESGNPDYTFMEQYVKQVQETIKLQYLQEKVTVAIWPSFFPLAVQLQVCLVALKGINADNIILYAPELYHVACGKACPVADLKQHFFVKLCGDAV